MATHELDLALQTADELWLAGYDTGLEVGFPEDLVLSGKIDQVFQLKGFDLKTGHLKKKTDRRNIPVTGEGHLLLWTKNALERNGYSTRPGDGLGIEIITGESLTHWKTTTGKTFKTLKELVNYLDGL